LSTVNLELSPLLQYDLGLHDKWIIPGACAYVHGSLNVAGYAYYT
jgi:hypothetical protein